MDVWVGVMIAGVIGFALGALVMWAMDRKQSGGTSVASLKKEHEEFREQVTDHFVETAERINRLTDSYKDLFDHLSHGAETLVDDASLRERMPQVSDQEVRLKRLGTQTRHAETVAVESPKSQHRSSDEPDAPEPSGGAKAGTGAEASAKPSAAESSATQPAAETSTEPPEEASSTEPPAEESAVTSTTAEGQSETARPAPESAAKAGSPPAAGASDTPTPAPASGAKAGKPAD